MASNSEKTHAKNYENLNVVNNIIAGLGAGFNPKNPLITTRALTGFADDFAAKTQAVSAALPAEQAAVGEQIAAFKQVSPRVARILKAAKGLGLAPEYLDSLRSTSNRLNGVRVTAKTPDNPETVEDESQSNQSSSRRSYAGILESLDLLDNQLKSSAAYAPNETEYQSETVTAWVTDLRAKHDAALAAKTATRNARAERTNFAYNKTDGLIVRMNALKAYAETILDKNDARLKQLKKLKFVDYSK